MQSAKDKVSFSLQEEGQEPTETSKQLIITHYLGHVTGYQPIRDQYFPVLGQWVIEEDTADM